MIKIIISKITIKPWFLSKFFPIIHFSGKPATVKQCSTNEAPYAIKFFK